MSAPPIEGILIEDELGRGAHSVVYRAQLRGVPCALKLPRTKARWTRWIYREAVALARVKHPRLPVVLEVGESDGLPYLAMELVEGETLAERLRRGPLAEDDVLALATQLASVLGAVHEAGLVHRDVKPRNLIVDEGGALKLVDFGFATPMERVDAGDGSGTAAYAAPEQLSTLGRVDGRSDLYAVGRVLLECLEGQLPNEGGLASELRLRLRAAGVSGGLADVIAGLLGARAEDRYCDATALAQDLALVRGGDAPLGPGAYTHVKAHGRLVGRERELFAVLGALRRIADGGKVVLLRGRRGEGKSRMSAEIARAVRGHAIPILIECAQDASPLATVGRVVDAYCAALVAAGVTRAELQDLFGGLLAIARLVAPFTMDRLFGHDEEPARISRDVSASDALVEGVAEIVLRLARRVGPSVVIIDDAHWMAPTSIDVFLRLAHQAAHAAIGLVLAARPTTALDGFALVHPARLSTVELEPLSVELVGRLIAAYLGDPNADAALATRVSAMADGTPLGVLEVLGSFLDAGCLRPQGSVWRFDAERADAIALPKGAIVLLGRRVADLPAATRRVLEVAAVVGVSFDEDLVAALLELTLEDLGFGLASARRAGLVEAQETGRHRFVHDSIRELLVDDLAVAERRRIHQRIAERIADGRAELSFEELCAAAQHFALGETEENPTRAYAAARSAADAALARFDNETAHHFYGMAERFAVAASVRLDPDFFRNAGEANLRLGSLAESQRAFEAALRASEHPEVRAALLGRLSWVHQANADPERAWEILGRAFEALGHEMPIESVTSALSTSAHVARRTLGDLVQRRATGPRAFRAKIDLLCALHYQNTRLGLEYGKAARTIQSSLEASGLSERGGSPATVARSLAGRALVLSVFGRHQAAARGFEEAKTIAEHAGDPALIAFCAEMVAIGASWAGDLDRGLVLFRQCIELHGPWIEINEIFLMVASAELIESIRGRASEAFGWIERACDRLRRSRVRPATTDLLIHRARAALTTMGLETRDDPWLAALLESVPPSDSGRGYHRLSSWGPRARYLVDSGHEEELEALVRAFEAEGHNPRTVHLAVAEYYVTLAHARVHQLLRSKIRTPERLQQLRRAVADLSACARVPLAKAHALYAEGCLAYFEGKGAKADKRLAEAEALANAQSCPWVLFGVARIRAHRLRAAGHEAAAHDQARVAELLAKDHGASVRVRWIREDFGLEAPSEIATRSRTRTRGSSRSNRQLSAFLQVARAPRRDLRTEEQASAILDELLQILGAARAALLFIPEAGSVPLSVGRAVDRSKPIDETRNKLLRSVHDSGTPWPSEEGGWNEASSDVDAQRVAVVPLFLYDRSVGALCIERSSAHGPFSLEDRNLLVVLSHQVPIALEMARLLFEREQLHASLQHAKKMESMGALAGGLAHDFNNMLAAMRVALGAAQERAALDVELSVELDIIAQATTRAAQLTSQLLSFSRHQPVPVTVHDVNQLISTIEPMLRRVVGGGVEVVVELSTGSDAVEVDQGSFDQALVNLLINARDAMPNGGKITVSSRNVILHEAAAQRASVLPGEYVEITVADTGIGMSAETASRIFEPFFTTKPVGSGSGLGLAMVYAFARNCGGSIEVETELGQGTRFLLYLRRVDRTRASRPVRPLPTNAPGSLVRKDGPDTILVVDDDDLVRRSIAKILERNGYRVVAANGSAEALRVAREQGGRIALVILDVLMPGVTGPELGRRLNDLNRTAKFLFVSGFSPESIPIEEAKVATDMLLQKPFSQTTLLERVRQLMSQEPN